MSGKLECSRGWFHRETGDEVEIIRIWNSKSYTKVLYKYLDIEIYDPGEIFRKTLSEFKQLFRRKEDEG